MADPIAPAPYFYANQAQLIVSQWDITFSFQRMNADLDPKTGRLDTAAPGGHVVEWLEVGMSPQHTKAMLPLIFDQIESYENTIGKIPLDKDGQAKFDEFVRKVKAIK